tara:strand:- start:170 stop:364 length:195 start_codon:yes stop_codon:yes gene_type:complete
MGLLQSKPKKKTGTASAASSYSASSPTALTNELKPHVYGQTHGGKKRKGTRKKRKKRKGSRKHH